MRSALVATGSGVALKQKIAKSLSSSTYAHTSSVCLANQALSAKQITASTIAVGDWDGKIYLSNPPATLEQRGAVRAIAKINDDVFATAQHSQINVWDVNTHQQLRTFGPEQAALISDMVGFPNGLLAVVRWGSDRVEVWDANTGELKWSLVGHMDDVKYISALPRNRLATYAWDNQIRIWDLETGQSESVFASGHAGALVGLPDDRLVTATLSGLAVWADGKWVQDIKMQDIPWHPRLVVSPDGKLLVTAFKTAFRIVDLATQQTEDVYSLLMPDEILCTDGGHVVTFGPGCQMNCFRPK
jgi:WD40 repeat protein